MLIIDVCDFLELFLVLLETFYLTVEDLLELLSLAAELFFTGEIVAISSGARSSFSYVLIFFVLHFLCTLDEFPRVYSDFHLFFLWLFFFFELLKWATGKIYPICLSCDIELGVILERTQFLQGFPIPESIFLGFFR